MWQATLENKDGSSRTAICFDSGVGLDVYQAQHELITEKPKLTLFQETMAKEALRQGNLTGPQCILVKQSEEKAFQANISDAYKDPYSSPSRLDDTFYPLN